jgi:hypothetical protein
MKNLIILIFLILNIYAGEINNAYNKINKIDNINTRIEMKLDLIIQQYIKEEQTSELRAQAVDETIDKTKDGIKKGILWLSNKKSEILDH